MRNILKKHPLGNLCLSIKTLCFVALCLVNAPAAAQEPDTRQVVSLNAAQRAHVLQEMRGLLSGVQAIISAVAVDDRQTVETSARALGVHMGQKAEDTLHKALPKEFMQMGMSLHRKFDLLADGVQASQDSKHILKQLGDTLSGCQNCHELYRIEVADEKKTRVE